MSKNNVKKVLPSEVADFGDVVRRQMKLNGHTCAELAFALGIEPSNLSRILNARYNYGVSTYFLLRRYVNGDLPIYKPSIYVS